MASCDAIVIVVSIPEVTVGPGVAVISVTAGGVGPESMEPVVISTVVTVAGIGVLPVADSVATSVGVEESVVENRKDLGLRRWRVVGKDRRRCLPRGEVSRACEANGNTGQAFPLSAPPPDPAASLRPAARRVRERLANP